MSYSRYFLVVVMLVLGACASKKAADRAVAQQLQGTWELTLFTPGGKGFAEVFGQRRPELVFHTTENRVSGNTGCNHMTGTYSINGQRFQFGADMAITKMACQGYDESSFLQAMTSINRFQINNNQLNLLNDSTLIMSFARK